MPEEKAAPPKPTTLLGNHLAAIRRDRGFSLRQVESLSRNLVSNAYLSQIESGKIQQPSPNILHALAQVYKISYEHLMQMAGFITASRKRTGAAHGRAATFAELNLSDDEEHELLEYLRFRRSLREKASEGG